MWIFIIELPDFFVYFVARIFSILWVTCVEKSSSMQENPGNFLQGYTTKIPGTFLRRDWAKKSLVISRVFLASSKNDKFWGLIHITIHQVVHHCCVRTGNGYQGIATTNKRTETTSGEREGGEAKEKNNCDYFRDLWPCPIERFHVEEVEDARFAGF